MSRAPIIYEDGTGRRASVEAPPRTVLESTLQAFLLSRRRAVKSELIEIERLLRELGVDLRPMT